MSNADLTAYVYFMTCGSIASNTVVHKNLLNTVEFPTLKPCYVCRQLLLREGKKKKQNKKTSSNCLLPTPHHNICFLPVKTKQRKSLQHFQQLIKAIHVLRVAMFSPDLGTVYKIFMTQLLNVTENQNNCESFELR